jgi:hypothetical protein
MENNNHDIPWWILAFWLVGLIVVMVFIIYEVAKGA